LLETANGAQTLIIAALRLFLAVMLWWLLPVTSHNTL
jgi:hypothetical protein